MQMIDILAPPIDGVVVDELPAFVDHSETTEVSLDVMVDDGDDGWLTRLLDEAELQRLVGDKGQALELLGVALRIDGLNDVVRARYFELAAELTGRPRRGDETLQIAQR